MNRYKIVILPAILLLLAGCTRSAVISSPSVQVSGENETSFPSHAETPAPSHEVTVKKDRLPEGISEDFMAFIKSTYGTSVYDRLITSFESGSDGNGLWHELTGNSLLVLKDLYSGILNSPDAARSHHIWLKESSDPNQVVLSFAGDISFADGYANMSAYHARGGIDSCILTNVRARMAAADIMMINNEFSYSRRGKPLPGKAFTFRADPSMAQNLHSLSVDLVSLANNHVYDYGADALIDTLDTLSYAEIPYAGAGRNIEEAKEPVYFISGGMKISFVCATQIERSTRFTKEAGPDSPGVLRTDDPELYLGAVKTAKENSDFVVVFIHWGTEGTNYFGEDQQDLARQLIDHGAGLIIGCHPHVLQGMEYYKGVPIVYSLGNFWFNSKTIPTGLVEATVTPNGLNELQFIPCIQESCSTDLVISPDDKQKSFQFMEQLSSSVTIDTEGFIHPLPE
jgi:poly-gamma-glutamate synthesis protein (capsule biosynthesis protein)